MVGEQKSEPQVHWTEDPHGAIQRLAIEKAALHLSEGCGKNRKS